MRALGLNPSEDDVKKIIDGIDPSGKQTWGRGWSGGGAHVGGTMLECIPEFVGVCVCASMRTCI